MIRPKERRTNLPYNTGVIIGDLMFPSGMGCTKYKSCFECCEPDCTAHREDMRNNGKRVTLDRC